MENIEGGVRENVALLPRAKWVAGSRMVSCNAFCIARGATDGRCCRLRQELPSLAHPLSTLTFPGLRTHTQILETEEQHRLEISYNIEIVLVVMK